MTLHQLCEAEKAVTEMFYRECARAYMTPLHWEDGSVAEYVKYLNDAVDSANLLMEIRKAKSTCVWLAASRIKELDKSPR